MRRNFQRDTRLLVLWVLVLCLLGGVRDSTAQAVLSAVKKSSSNQKKKSEAKQEPAPAEAEPAPAPATPPPPPVDPLGRTDPHGCVLGFLRAAEAGDYAKAAQYLEGKRSEQQGEELAKQLKSLVDLGLSTGIDKLSRSPTGTYDDKLRVSRERVGVVKTPQGDLDILLELVKRPDEPPPIWLFSQETLNKVPEAYASMQHKDYSQRFPEWSKRIHVLSVPLWRWFVVLISIVIFLLVSSLLTKLLVWCMRAALRKGLRANVEEAILRLRGPIFGLILSFLLDLSATGAITALARHYWEMFGALVGWISAAWLLLRLTDILVAYERNRLLLRMRVERVTFLGLVARFFKILIVIVLVLILLRGAGVNVSAVVAGLGIGGIALALAAQSTLADLFGGLSVVLRGAVRVGDFCQIDGISGTVEDIGTSSLSLRTLDRSLVSIPNSKVAQVKLENFALRDQFWLHQVFTLQFDTPYSVMEAVLEGFRDVLTSNSEIERESARARLINLTATGPQIEIFGYFRRPGADWSAFLAEQEKIILKMLSIVEAEGASLAAPVSVLQMEREKRDLPVDSGVKSR